jgi:unsaturated rhamnogalacturonyl hydrolase
MKRRKFLEKTLSYGTATGASLIILKGQSLSNAPEKRTFEETIEKVKTAMLSMQRQAWEQGVAAQALLEMGERELVILMAKEAVLRQWGDGRLAQICDNHGVTDPGANGEAVLYSAKITGDSALEAAADKMLDYLLHKAPKTKDGTLYHIDNKLQVWIDSMYMAPPFLAVAGHSEEAVKQIEGFRKLLWNKEKKLFSHIWDDSLNSFYRKDFWGVGNGWASAGMTRVIKAFPENMASEKKHLAKCVKEVIDGCLAHQRPDGLFHDVLDNRQTFVETNLAQMLAYSIYRGIRGGWLQSSYQSHADKMRAAAYAKVDELGLVQGVCGSPEFTSAGVATEGQAFFLLMEVAYRDLNS